MRDNDNSGKRYIENPRASCIRVPVGVIFDPIISSVRMFGERFALKKGLSQPAKRAVPRRRRAARLAALLAQGRTPNHGVRQE